MLNDEVKPVGVLEYSAYNDAPHTLLRVPRSSQTDLMTNGDTCKGAYLDGSVKMLKTVDEVVYAKFNFAGKRNENDEVLEAASICEQHVEPLMLACSHNVSAFRAARNDND
jgi:hypothetical protein